MKAAMREQMDKTPFIYGGMGRRTAVLGLGFRILGLGVEGLGCWGLA